MGAKWFWLAAGALVATLATTDVRAATVTLTPDPDPARVAVGDGVAVTLAVGEDFGEFAAVNANVTYDADVLRYEEPTFGPDLGFLSAGREQPAGARGATTIEDVTTTFQPEELGGSGPGSGPAVLVTFNFSAVGLGRSEVTVEGFNGQLVVPPDPNAEPFDGRFTTGVEVVPLPAPILLLASALAGLGVLRHRAQAVRVA
jgi:hypothetical protein